MSGRVRRLMTYGDPDELVEVPAESDFVSDVPGFKVDFLDAPEVKKVAEALIGEYPELERLQWVAIDFLYKKKGGGRGGSVTLGATQKVGGLASYYSQGTQIVIWVAADHLSALQFTRWQLEALVYHELKHVQVDENNKVGTVGHECELFGQEVFRYGAWRENLKSVAAAFKQLTLDEVA